MIMFPPLYKLDVVCQVKQPVALIFQSGAHKSLKKKKVQLDVRIQREPVKPQTVKKKLSLYFFITRWVSA